MGQPTLTPLDRGDPRLGQPQQPGELQLGQPGLRPDGEEHRTEVVAGQRAAHAGLVVETLRNGALKTDGPSTGLAHGANLVDPQ